MYSWRLNTEYFTLYTCMYQTLWPILEHKWKCSQTFKECLFIFFWQSNFECIMLYHVSCASHFIVKKWKKNLNDYLTMTGVQRLKTQWKPSLRSKLNIHIVKQVYRFFSHKKQQMYRNHNNCAYFLFTTI